MPALTVMLLVLLAFIALVALIIFIYWWWEWRGMRGLPPIVRAYARLERYLPLIGIHLRPQQTPEERRQQVARSLPAAEPPVTTITQLYTMQRYGKKADPATVDPERVAPQDERAKRAWWDARGKILKRWLRRRFVFWRRD